MRKIQMAIRMAWIRIHTCCTLKDAMHGMTLNAIGQIYGVEREPGEENGSFERRILAAAIKGDEIRLKRMSICEEGAKQRQRRLKAMIANKPPKPATGTALDGIATKYGLQRCENETDEHLQGRVREAVMNRMCGKAEGGEE